MLIVYTNRVRYPCFFLPSGRLSDGMTSSSSLFVKERLDGRSSEGEFPFVNRHSRVVAAFGASPQAMTFIAGVGHEMIMFCPAARGVRQNSVRCESAIVHLSLCGGIAASLNGESGLDGLTEIASASRTGVVAATSDGAVLRLGSSLMTQTTPPQPSFHSQTRVPGSSPLTAVRWEPLVAWDSSLDDATAGLRPLLGSTCSAICVERLLASPTASDCDAIVMCHEHFNEARILDLATGVTRTRFYTSHNPVALQVMHCPSFSSSIVAIAEGPIVSFWDLRQRQGKGSCVSRTTLCDADVLDVCCSSDLATLNIFALASTSRCVTMYDVRKWSAVSTESNVLKHEPVGLACAGVNAQSQASLIVVGIDSEVRAIDLATNPLSAKKAKGSAAVGSCSMEQDTEGGTFKRRIATSQHCRAAWHGSPASCKLQGGRAAVSMSTHGELFTLLPVLSKATP